MRGSWRWWGVPIGGLVLLGVVYGCGAEREPPPPPAPHTPFPTERIVKACGSVGEHGALPEAMIDDRWEALAPLSARALKIHVCGARTRSEVAMATTLIGLRAVEGGNVEGGLQTLRYAADTWFEPMAHVELGLVYLAGEIVPRDPGRAWRYLAAGLAIASDVAQRSGDSGLLRLIEQRTEGAMASFDQPDLRRRFDRRVAAASTRRFSDARVSAYREVYLGPSWTAPNN